MMVKALFVINMTALLLIIASWENGQKMGTVFLTIITLWLLEASSMAAAIAHAGEGIAGFVAFAVTLVLMMFLYVCTPNTHRWVDAYYAEKVRRASRFTFNYGYDGRPVHIIELYGLYAAYCDDMVGVGKTQYRALKDMQPVGSVNPLNVAAHYREMMSVTTEAE